MNTKIEQFKADLIHSVNESGLPIGIIYYVYKDVMNIIASEYQQAIQAEQTQSDEKEEVTE